MSKGNAACLFLIVVLHGHSVFGQTFRGLGDLPGGFFSSMAWGVSGDGRTVVGEGNTSTGYEAFRWKNGVMSGLGFLPGAEDTSAAFDVSFDGSVIIGTSRSSLLTEAFRWENGTMTGLGDLPGGGPRSEARAVSADGSVIVGLSGTDAPTEAFIWEGGAIASAGIPAGFQTTILGAISASGLKMVGSATKPLSGGSEVLVVDNGLTSTFSPFGAFNSGAGSISGNGEVIVGAYHGTSVTCPSNCIQGFVHQSGISTTLNDFGLGSSPTAVSYDGSVIVGLVTGLSLGPNFNPNHAVIWRNGGQIQFIQDLLTDLNVQSANGWQLAIATDVSDDGSVIVGWGFNPDGNEEAWIINLNAVPEPCSFLCGFAGAIAMGWLFRMR